MTPRDIFFKEIHEYLLKGADIYIVTPDFGSSVLDEIKKDYPERVLNVGVAEQNAILVGCGLALIGKIVVIYGMSCFIVSRCYEQLKVDIDGMNIPITIVGVGFDDEYKSAGYTHWAYEDKGLMTTLNNIEIKEPESRKDILKLVRRAIERKKPLYIKLHR